MTPPPWESFLPVVPGGYEKASQGPGLGVKTLPPFWSVLHHVTKTTAAAPGAHSCGHHDEK